MKLGSEGAENGDFSGPEYEFKNRFLNRKSAIIGARSSRLHAICGVRLRLVSSSFESEPKKPLRSWVVRGDHRRYDLNNTGHSV